MKNSMMEVKVAEIEIQGFMPRDVIGEFSQKTSEGFKNYERIVLAQLWREVKENPKAHDKWEQHREISLPIRFSDAEEKACFGRRNQYEIKDKKDLYSEKLERKLEAAGWDAEVTSAWITLRMPQKNLGIFKRILMWFK